MNLRKLAKGQECTVNIFGVCNHDPETTVLAHLNGAGMGLKHPDLHGAWCCSDCHAWLDGGYTKTHYREQRDLYHAQAVFRTQRQILKMGLQEVIDKWSA